MISSYYGRVVFEHEPVGVDPFVLACRRSICEEMHAAVPVLVGLFPYGVVSPHKHELFAPGAFARDVDFARAHPDLSDLRLLLRHDDSRVIASVRDENLSVYESLQGIRFETRLVGPYARELRGGAGRFGVSVGYRVLESRRERIRGQDIKVTTDASLDEISLACCPAFPGTLTWLQRSRNPRALLRELDQLELEESRA